MATFCNNCGTQLEDGVLFCANCRTNTAPDQQAAPPQQQYAPSPSPEQAQQYAPSPGLAPQYAPSPEQVQQYAPSPEQAQQYAPSPGQAQQYATPPGQAQQYAQPQPQYAPSGQAAYVIPKLKLTKQHLLIIIIAAAAIVAVLLIVNQTQGNDRESGGDDFGTIQIGGSEGPKPGEDIDSIPPPVETGGESTPNPGGTDGGSTPNPGGTGGGGTIANSPDNAFPPIPLSEYPKGIWSINQLTAKFGQLKDAEALIAPNSLCMVFAVYSNLKFNFSGVPARELSFNSKLNTGEYYPLPDKDRDIMLELLSATLTGEDIDLPLGIKIGTSTKSQVIAAYGEAPMFESDEGDTEISYAYYRFDNVNTIVYLFNIDDDVLESANLTLVY